MSNDYLNKTAKELDAGDELASFRSEFYLPVFEAFGADLVDPSLSKEPCTYLCGNSLGPLSKRSSELVKEELDVWATRAVEGHFKHPHDRPWVPTIETLAPSLARLVGAKTQEVACMSTLTANLHLMMTSFYKPTKERFKIICEAKAFPSDRLHGFDPAEAVIEVAPRPGEFALREEDILSVIKQHGSSIALVLFSGVQYYTGQWFPMESITKAGHAEGAVVGWDLAHAIGNVYPLKLHDWQVDFAVWCSYKYLNSGPGGIGGLFVHSNWDTESPPKLHGWWGHDSPTRFRMPRNFKQIPGAAGYQQSNPSALLAASLLGSLELFDRLPSSQNSPDTKSGEAALRKKSVMLTNWLENQLRKSKYFFDVGTLGEVFSGFGISNASVDVDGKEEETGTKTEDGKLDPRFTIITPSPFSPSTSSTSSTSDNVDLTTNQIRGAQLSLLWPAGEGTMQRVFKGLKRRGVIGDERDPDVIRLSPAPMYNSFGDCERAVKVLEEVLDEVARSEK